MIEVFFRTVESAEAKDGAIWELWCLWNFDWGLGTVSINQGFNNSGQVSRLSRLARRVPQLLYPVAGGVYAASPRKFALAWSNRLVAWKLSELLLVVAWNVLDYLLPLPITIGALGT